MKKLVLLTLVLALCSLPALSTASSTDISGSGLTTEITAFLHSFYDYQYKVLSGEEFSEDELSKYFDLTDPDSYDFYEHEYLMLSKTLKQTSHYITNGTDTRWSEYKHSIMISKIDKSLDGLLVKADLDFRYNMYYRKANDLLGGVLNFTFLIGENENGFYLKQKKLDGFYDPIDTMQAFIDNYRAQSGGKSYSLGDINAALMQSIDESIAGVREDLAKQREYMKEKGFTDPEQIRDEMEREAVEMQSKGISRAYDYTVYDRNSAVSTALAYYNTSTYPSPYQYQYSGGDCTNFTSFCLHEGGGIPFDEIGTFQWYYYSQTNKTAAWTAARYFRAHYKNNVGSSSIPGIPAYSGTHLNLRKGDMIQNINTSADLATHSLIISNMTTAFAATITINPRISTQAKTQESKKPLAFPKAPWGK